MQILKFKGLDEIINRAHDTIYGLAAAVFTKDVEKAIYLSNSIRAGTVWLVHFWLNYKGTFAAITVTLFLVKDIL